VGWIDLSIRTYWENREKKKRKERKKKEITERDDS
jgi:predicted RNA-binding protein with RPS1 domain